MGHIAPDNPKAFQWLNYLMHQTFVPAATEKDSPFKVRWLLPFHGTERSLPNLKISTLLNIHNRDRKDESVWDQTRKLITIENQ